MLSEKSIKTKFLTPILTVLMISSLILGFAIYYAQKKVLFTMMEDTCSSNVSYMKKSIDSAVTNVQDTQKLINKYLISITKAVEADLRRAPDNEKVNEINSLINNLGIQEIHISDSNGKIQWTNISEFTGFDFNSSEQSKPFIECLKDKNLTIVQEPKARGADKKLFQYIGVATQDKPGILQIGLDPKEAFDITNRLDIKALANSHNFAHNGHIVILDKKGLILSHPDKKLLGKNISSYEWSKNIKFDGKGEFEFNFNNTPEFMSYESYKDYVICAVIPTSEYLGYLNNLKLILFAIISMFILATITIIIVTSQKVVVNRIHNLLQSINEVSEGNLELSIADKGNDEISKVTLGFNSMVKNLREVVNKIKDTSQVLNKSSLELSESFEYIVSTEEQIGISINEIAQGSSNQVQETEKGIDKLESLSEGIDNITQNAKIIDSEAKLAGDRNGEGGKAILDLKEKFLQNASATKDVEERIQMLSEKSSKIGNITEAITEIAEQTNLLALNASIEAARAGEHGKGFAVVAGEVKKLAEESSKSVEQIDILVKEINQDIIKVVSSIGIAGRIVRDVNNEFENTNRIFNVLESSNETIINLIKNLYKNLEILNENKKEVVSSIHNISLVSVEAAASTEEISSSTEQQIVAINNISHTTKELTSISGQFNELIKIFN